MTATTTPTDHLLAYMGRSLDQVTKSYSGRPGCACGCRGNYSQSARSIKIIAGKITKLLDGIDPAALTDDFDDHTNADGQSVYAFYCADYIAVETNTRAYTLYFN